MLSLGLDRSLPPCGSPARVLKLPPSCARVTDSPVASVCPAEAPLQPPPPPTAAAQELEMAEPSLQLEQEELSPSVTFRGAELAAQAGLTFALESVC